jgi:hypothetical protein
MFVRSGAEDDVPGRCAHAIKRIMDETRGSASGFSDVRAA